MRGGRRRVGSRGASPTPRASARAAASPRGRARRSWRRARARDGAGTRGTTRRKLLGAWGETHARAAAAAKRLEERARAREQGFFFAVGWEPGGEGGPPGAEGTAPARGSPVVKEGTSFAFAAGARSKPAPAASGAENGGADAEKRKGGSSHAEKERDRRAKSGATGRGKKGHKRGQAGNKGGRPRVGARRRPRPLIASSASFVPASAVKAALVCSSEQAKTRRPRSETRGGDGQPERQGSRVHAPRATLREFVPKSKDKSTLSDVRVRVRRRRSSAVTSVRSLVRSCRFVIVGLFIDWISRARPRRPAVLPDVDEVTGRGLRRLLAAWWEVASVRRRPRRATPRWPRRSSPPPPRRWRAGRRPSAGGESPAGDGALDAHDVESAEEVHDRRFVPSRRRPRPIPGVSTPPPPRPTRQPRASRPPPMADTSAPRRLDALHQQHSADEASAPLHRPGEDVEVLLADRPQAPTASPPPPASGHRRSRRASRRASPPPPPLLEAAPISLPPLSSAPLTVESPLNPGGPTPTAVPRPARREDTRPRTVRAAR